MLPSRKGGESAKAKTRRTVLSLNRRGNQNKVSATKASECRKMKVLGLEQPGVVGSKRYQALRGFRGTDTTPCGSRGHAWGGSGPLRRDTQGSEKSLLKNKAPPGGLFVTKSLK